ncbi:MAG: Sensor histidine kinase BtsS [Luteibacter sp.]|uniref:sensor histidine kinase n=1 Tax=Luteibacter sp. TaxID=1886636 RepID=UPI0013833F72|nr:histidine kinase [Luteibacter sp.]KAF1004767.1 MAG: Sensor histidine kinase BtsS [Luteibacter sp.]
MRTGEHRAAPARSWIRRFAPWLWVGILLAIGLLRASNRYLVGVANDQTSPFLPKLIEELTGAFSFGAFLPVLFFALRRMPATWYAHLGLFVGLSLAQTSLMIGVRWIVFGMLDMPGYAYPPTVWRYLMEAPTQLFFYVMIATGLWLVDRYREGKARELRSAQLESALSEARLDALRLQLNPHFLFNTLNAVSELMYDRPRVADEMLSRIGELLRATLSATAQEHPLANEWRLLSLYLDIQRARFGEGLDAVVDGDASLDDMRVPFLVLQPLVENAIEHGGTGDDRRVRIGANREGGKLIVRIRDFGGGEPRAGHGIGLRNVDARLRHLYGDAAGVRLDPVPDGGSQVTLWLPAHRWELA